MLLSLAWTLSAASKAILQCKMYVQVFGVTEFKDFIEIFQYISLGNVGEERSPEIFNLGQFKSNYTLTKTSSKIYSFWRNKLFDKKG